MTTLDKCMNAYFRRERNKKNTLSFQKALVRRPQIVEAVGRTVHTHTLVYIDIQYDTGATYV